MIGEKGRLTREVVGKHKSETILKLIIFSLNAIYMFSVVRIKNR